MNAPNAKRTAILISGRGSNAQALIEAARERDYPASIELVLSDKADAPGLELARKAGIPAKVVARKSFASREAHDAGIDAALGEARVELVCLAGYMRLLTPDFVEKWEGRMINIHPSLLPSFKGLETHARALEAGVRLHGCTVHFVTVEMDSGPIVAQAAVPAIDGDSAELLAARVLRAEHRLYPYALDLVASGRARIAGGKVVLSGVGDPDREGLLASPGITAPARSATDLESLARLTP